MKQFSTLTSTVAPLDRANVDTDQIIPKQFLRSIERTGFGQFLFDEWRYLDRGELGMDCSLRPLNQEFSLNHLRYAAAKVLLARDNFGCGSSREHAVWALLEYGFDAVIAPSFGDIFTTNAMKNGLLLLSVPAATAALFAKIAADGAAEVTIDLPAQTIISGADTWAFDILADYKTRLLEGVDDIALTLRHSDAIREYEKRRQAQEPWLFHDR